MPGGGGCQRPVSSAALGQGGQPPLALRPLSLADEAEAVAAHRELAVDHFDFLLEGWDEETEWRPQRRWLASQKALLGAYHT